MKISNNGQTSLGRRLVLLAASTDLVPPAIKQVRVDAQRHRQFLQSAQRLRGAVYLADGAIVQSDLTPDGRFASPMDQQCWHFLTLNENGEVRGAIRYRPHLPPLRFEQLGIALSALARDREWGLRLRRAVEAEVGRAQSRGILFVEVGGWAMGKELRCSAESVRLALTSFALALISGGAVGVVNATQRHNSAQILRKVGGAPLEWQGTELPPYYDPRYRCLMEILRFDSAQLPAKLALSVAKLAGSLGSVEVIAGRDGVSDSLASLHGSLEAAEPRPEVAHAR